MALSDYTKNEIVLCLSPTDNNWHKAKIMYIKIHNSRKSYKIHYYGWNSSWDEWISEPFRLCKASKDPTICKQILESKRKEYKQLIINNTTKTEEINNQNNENDQNNENNVSVNNVIEIGENMNNNLPNYARNGIICILPLSVDIRMNIYNQYKLICENSILLISIPKPKHLTINSICNQFIEQQQIIIEKENKFNPNQEKSFCNEIINSVKYFFNAFICVNILFDIEKQQQIQLLRQYGNNINMNIDYCDIYGVEHLFRLIWNLPKIYQKVKGLNGMQAAKVSNYISLFNGFLTKCIHVFSVEFNVDKNPQNIGLIMVHK